MRLRTGLMAFLATLTLLGGAASLVAAQGTTPAPAVPQPTPAVPAPTFEPDQTSPGAAGGERLYRAAEVVDSLVRRQPARFTGVRIIGANSLLVALPRGADVADRIDAVRLVLAGANADRGVSVTFSEVKYSRAAMIRVKTELIEIMKAGEYDGQMIGVGEDGSLGVAVIYATTGSESARLELKSRYGDTVVFRHADVPKALSGPGSPGAAATVSGR